MEMSYQVSYQIPFYTQRVKDVYVDLEGFNNIEDALYWQERGCGIACSRMIIGAYYPELLLSYGELLNKGLNINGFCDKGWIHQKLIELINSYGINGKSYRHSDSNRIVTQINKNKPCIVSVSPCFSSDYKGGHLVVVSGYTFLNNQLYSFIVNHPSSHENYNWENKKVPISQFENSFSGSFMSFWT